uniref:Roadblock/LC7 domain-containing protein n=1 Tax=Haemonchus contortus TaxID=6289 RepID=A0A7I4YAZ6_HAECO|nr:Gem-associated protein 7 [Haemonchus contortus]
MTSASDTCDEVADARERYLRFFANAAGSNVTVAMHEKTSVTGVLVAMKGDGSHFLVDQLKTPIGVMDSAVLRTADTIMMTMDWNDVNRHK